MRILAALKFQLFRRNFSQAPQLPLANNILTINQQYEPLYSETSETRIDSRQQLLHSRVESYNP